MPYFACRGYVSQSEMWAAGQRFVSNSLSEEPQESVVLHLGDHDPSGLDMTRDIEDRLRMFMEEYSSDLSVVRLALNWDQIEEWEPPPNPAKLSDSRASHYVEEWGDESWELDALPPSEIVQMIEAAVSARLDHGKWRVALEKEDKNRQILYDAKGWVFDEVFRRNG